MNDGKDHSVQICEALKRDGSNETFQDRTEWKMICDALSFQSLLEHIFPPFGIGTKQLLPINHFLLGRHRVHSLCVFSLISTVQLNRDHRER